MKNAKLPGAIGAALLLASAHANAQIVINPISFLQPESSVIGPDGTYYALVPGAGSTFQSPASQLIAVSPAGKGTAWTADLNARVTQVLPGATTVFVVETAISGTGRNATSTTTIALVSAGPTGGTVSGTTIAPTGTITDIEERTIGSADYLYIVTVSTSTPTPAPGASTTNTTTRTLTIYSSAGAVLNTATL
jgi:hypothetical protein